MMRINQRLTMNVHMNFDPLLIGTSSKVGVRRGKGG
jgi:hypothetical protein